MADSKQQKGNKNRKYGRNKNSSVRYIAEFRRYRNKVRKLARHLKLQPNDRQAHSAFISINKVGRIAYG